ncbi:hypothetical protein MRX96_030047 [Rhipicephalus microplus]
MTRKVIVVADKADLHSRLKDLIQEVADTFVSSGNEFLKVGVSGGSMPGMLAQVLPGVKTEEQFVLVNTSLPPSEAAQKYSEKLKEYFKTVPKFDLLLLGMGPDGHTCSLFPGHKLLEEKTKWVADITDSPKPPPCRVTLTYPVINSTKLAIFPIAGVEKAATVAKVLHPMEGEPRLPASLVEPTEGDVVWLLDSGAASQLPK